MLWALDRFGNLVAAAQGGMSIGLVCPTCNAPVMRRAGRERRAHFAHYSDRANPDCENYFPPQYLNSVVPKGLPDGYSTSGQHSLKFALVLIPGPNNSSWSLALRIPELAGIGRKVGVLEIRSKMGTKVLTPDHLDRRQLIHLSPNVPLADIHGTQDLHALALTLMSHIQPFSKHQNIFVRNENGGRFQFPEEPVVWGGCYWVVAEGKIQPSDEVQNLLAWRGVGTFGGWSVFETELPRDPAGLTKSQIGEIASFLDRRIRLARPTAHIAFPWPHHLEGDGAYVYSEYPRTLLLRTTFEARTSVNCGAASTSLVSVTQMSERWVSIEGLDLVHEDVTIAVDGIECLLLSRERSPMFFPAGISAISGNAAWDLITGCPPEVETDLGGPIELHCPTERVANCFGGRSERSSVNGTVVSMDLECARSMESSSFGRILLAKDSAQEGGPFEPLEESKARNGLGQGVWIEWLVAKTYGEHWRRPVRAFLADPSPSHFANLGPIGTSGFMPYLRAAAGWKSTGEECHGV